MASPRFAAALFGLLWCLAVLPVHAVTPRVEKSLFIREVRFAKPGSSIAVVRVPKGTRRVTLQSLVAKKNWVTRAVAHPDGSGADVTFQVPRTANRSNLRVIGSTSDTLPANFFKGKAEFSSVSQSRPVSAVAGLVALGSLNAASASVATTQAAVTEADIWKISGNTLYFFNQYRGLQIIDITNPDAPTLKGTLNLPAVGEDMYVLDASHVVLLARIGSDWTESEVISVSIADGSPTIAARLPFNGQINTSRMAGNALYVVSGGWQAGADGQWGTQLSSFDFSDPAVPIARSSFWLTGYNSVSMATDGYLFVTATGIEDWTHSTIQIVDITAANGTMLLKGTISTAGTVPDKFKMGLRGNVFTAISQVWSSSVSGASTKLETFSLADPSSPVKLGEVALGAGDWLYGTRFDGSLAYIVTATRVDPLWIVDLSDPAHPVVASHLEVPGYSTFLQPLGGRLVTLGVVNGQVAVSMFDVHDPTSPTLLNRVSVGSGTYSWSSANFDEKAFSVLSDAQLILLPVESYDLQSGQATQVQLIDIGSSSLTKRGVIDAKFGPRRATVFNDRILSISGQELLTVDATNRDLPAVTSDAVLAWPVNRVFVQGDYLIEVETGGSWWNHSAPTVRVALASSPDTVVTEVNLDGAPINGATVRDGKLYLAQADSQSLGMVPLTFNSAISGTGNTSTLTVSIYNLANLPVLEMQGTTSTPIEPLGWSPTLNALWPKPGLLVWVAEGGRSWPIFYATPVLASAAGSLTLNGSGSVGSTAVGTSVTGGTISSSILSANPLAGSPILSSSSGMLLGCVVSLLTPTGGSGAELSSGSIISIPIPGGTLVLDNSHVRGGGTPVVPESIVPVGDDGEIVVNEVPVIEAANRPTSGVQSRPMKSSILTSASRVTFTNDSAGLSAGPNATLVIGGGIYPIWWGGISESRLLAFNVGDATKPYFVAETKFAKDAWSVGSTFAGDNLIYSSHSGSWKLTLQAWSWVKKSKLTASSGWEQGWYVDSVDYSNPAAPVMRDPVSIPNELVGVSNASSNGAVLYCMGTDGLSACAYDGLSASLIDSVALPGGTNPAIVDGANVFVGRATGPNSSGGEIDTWTLSQSGNLVQLGSVSLGSAFWRLQAVGDVLAVQSSGGIQFFDKSNPPSLHVLGGGDSLWSATLDYSDGDASRGLWIPLGDYGVQFLGVEP